MIVTQRGFDGTVRTVKRAPIMLMAASVAACGGCVQVQAPDKPIEINLNVNIKQEVVYSLKQDAADIINNNPGLFPK